jgi:hypothetical protein
MLADVHNSKGKQRIFLCLCKSTIIVMNHSCLQNLTCLYHMLECLGKVYVTAEWLGTKIVEVNGTHFIFYTLCSMGRQLATQTEVRLCHNYYIVHAYIP